MSRALLVDDSSTLRAIATLVLTETGRWDVIEAPDGRNVVELARAYQPDVILLDVEMPHVDGESALAALLADSETATIPVIFLSAVIDASTTSHFLSLGAVGVLTKPFNTHTLADDIDAVLAGPVRP